MVNSLELKELRFPERSVWGPNSYHKREYKRHSVKRDIKRTRGFIGWPKIVAHVEAVKEVDVYAPRQKRNVAFVATLFETGGRIGEVLALKPEFFNFRYDTDPPITIVNGMLLEKRYEKTGEYISCTSCHQENEKWTRECIGCGRDLLTYGQRRYITRTFKDTVRNEFTIRLDEPLAPLMVEWIKDCKGEWLFPSPRGRRPTLSRQWAYGLVRSVGDVVGRYLYDHWFRAQRASHLAREYSMGEMILSEWFSWEKFETAQIYTKLGWKGQAQKMNVKIPA